MSKTRTKQREKDSMEETMEPISEMESDSRTSQASVISVQMQMFTELIEKMEQTRREETRKWEQQRKDDEKKWKDMLDRRSEAPATAAATPSAMMVQPTVPPFSLMDRDGADLAAFFVSFEAHMESYSVPRERWTIHLNPVLNSEARKAYAVFEGDVKANFDRTKEALLQHFHVGDGPTGGRC